MQRFAQSISMYSVLLEGRESSELEIGGFWVTGDSSECDTAQALRALWVTFFHQKTTGLTDL